MAGNAISRTMHIVDLARSATTPVPHRPLRTVGFWPYCSQEARDVRQKRRHADEKKQHKLLGGNVDSNLVNLHFHAAQAETNILKMLECLSSGIQPSDNDSERLPTQATIEHFLIIDNSDATPKVLFDWAEGKNRARLEEFAAETEEASRAMLEVILKVPEWYSLCNTVHRIAHFFLHDDHPLLVAAEDKATHCEDRAEAADLLPLLTVADEAVFKRLNENAVALNTTARDPTMALTVRGLGQLQDEISIEDATTLKLQLSSLRKFCVVLSMEHIRNDSDESSESENEDDGGGTCFSRAGTLNLEALSLERQFTAETIVIP